MTERQAFYEGMEAFKNDRLIGQRPNPYSDTQIIGNADAWARGWTRAKAYYSLGWLW